MNSKRKAILTEMYTEAGVENALKVSPELATMPMRNLRKAAEMLKLHKGALKKLKMFGEKT
jgi:hypothetical protein